ncbi:MAG: hypothetical protein PHU21_07710, partial [Elusimicrobia bacterium]|nr:hypothetical protein [Elusimicrobiota bacterium]
GEAILENIQDLAQVGTPEFRYQMEELTLFKRTAIDEFLRQAKLDVSAGKFGDAAAKLNEVVGLKPGDARLAESAARLKLVSDVYPEVKDFTTESSQAALYDGSLKFLAGKDQAALTDLAYAQSLRPGDSRTETLLAAIEAKSGLKRAAPPAAAPPASPADALAAHKKQLIDGYMALMEVSLRQYEYDKVITLAKQVTELDDANVLAYKRMGAAYHALQRYPEALAALLKAFERETDTEARKSLRSYITALQSVIKRGQGTATAAKPAAAARPPATPAAVEHLYEQGVEYYSRGQLKESADCFRRILEADPNDKSARQALRRVEAEAMQSGEGR